MKRMFVVLCCVVSMFWCFEKTTAQENTLVIWSHWIHEPVKRLFMDAVIEAFEEEYGIDVEIVWMAKYDLMNKLASKFNEPKPDISYIDYEFKHPRLWRSLLDLNDLQFFSPLDPSWSLGTVGDGNNNFLPIEGASSAIYYNKDLFKKAQIGLPQNRRLTEHEFLEIIRKLRKAGITPIGEGGVSDAEFKLGIPIKNAILRFAGVEKTAKLSRGDINFSDPDVVAALTFWKQVVDAQGYDPQKALTLSLSEGIYEVTDGKAAMNFCGTWIYGKYAETERDKGQIGVLDWFTVENGKGNDVYEISWVAGYGINLNSRYIPEAKKFLEFLMTPLASSLWVKYVQAPYPVLAEKIPENTLYGSLAAQRVNQTPIIQVLPFEAGYGIKGADNMWLEETRKFIAGEHTVKQFIERMNSRLE